MRSGVKWKESQGADRYRRGDLHSFPADLALPDARELRRARFERLSCPRRRRSNTPLQSLNLLNDPVFFEAAQGWPSEHFVKRPADFQDRSSYAFELAVGRKPNAHELQDPSKYFDEQKALFE